MQSLGQAVTRFALETLPHVAQLIHKSRHPLDWLPSIYTEGGNLPGLGLRAIEDILRRECTQCRGPCQCTSNSQHQRGLPDLVPCVYAWKDDADAATLMPRAIPRRLCLSRQGSAPQGLRAYS